MAAKAKTPSPPTGNFFAVAGSDDGMVREQALMLYSQLTGGLDDGFTHETIDGIAARTPRLRSARPPCSRC